MVKMFIIVFVRVYHLQRAAAATADKPKSQLETGLSALAQPQQGVGGNACLNTWCSDHVNSVEQPAATELSSSNSGQETSSSAASPPPQQDMDMEMDGPKTDPAKWSVSLLFVALSSWLVYMWSRYRQWTDKLRYQGKSQARGEKVIKSCGGQRTEFVQILSRAGDCHLMRDHSCSKTLFFSVNRSLNSSM